MLRAVQNIGVVPTPVVSGAEPAGEASGTVLDTFQKGVGTISAGAVLAGCDAVTTLGYVGEIAAGAGLTVAGSYLIFRAVKNVFDARSLAAKRTQMRLVDADLARPETWENYVEHVEPEIVLRWQQATVEEFEQKILAAFQLGRRHKANIKAVIGYLKELEEVKDVIDNYDEMKARLTAFIEQTKQKRNQLAQDTVFPLRQRLHEIHDEEKDLKAEVDLRREKIRARQTLIERAKALGAQVQSMMVVGAQLAVKQQKLEQEASGLMKRVTRIQSARQYLSARSEVDRLLPDYQVLDGLPVDARLKVMERIQGQTAGMPG